MNPITLYLVNKILNFIFTCDCEPLFKSLWASISHDEGLVLHRNVSYSFGFPSPGACSICNRDDIDREILRVLSARMEHKKQEEAAWRRARLDTNAFWPWRTKFLFHKTLSIPSSLKSIIACIITGNRKQADYMCNTLTQCPHKLSKMGFPTTVSPTQLRSTDNFFLCNYTNINGGYCGGE